MTKWIVYLCLKNENSIIMLAFIIVPCFLTNINTTMNVSEHACAIPCKAVIMMLMTVVASKEWAANVAGAEHDGAAEHSGRIPWR